MALGHVPARDGHPPQPPQHNVAHPHKVGIMITHAVGARHPNIVAGERGVEGEGGVADEADDAEEGRVGRSTR